MVVVSLLARVVSRVAPDVATPLAANAAEDASSLAEAPPWGRLNMIVRGSSESNFSLRLSTVKDAQGTWTLNLNRDPGFHYAGSVIPIARQMQPIDQVQ